MSPTNQSTYGQPHEGKYVAYVRVSTNKQDTERDEKDIRDFLGNKIENVTWYKENISGKVHPDNRPILQQAMQHAKKQKATIIISSISRLCRTTWHGLEYFEKNVETGKLNLVVCDDPLLSANPSENKMVLTLKLAMAQDMREKISVNTKTALARIQEKIEQKGFYYTKQGKKITQLGIHGKMDEAREKGHEVIQEEADAFAQRMRPVILDLVRQGYSLRQMASYLNNHINMYRTRRGGKWCASNVKNLLERVKKNELN